MATTEEALGGPQGALGQAPEMPENKWWQDRLSRIVIPRDLYLLGEGQNHASEVMPLFNELADSIELSALGYTTQVAQEDTNQRTIILNGVVGGELPGDVSVDLLFEQSLDRLKKTIKASMPEVKRPLSATRAKELGVDFGQVANLIFINDQNSSIKELYEREEKGDSQAYDALVALHRAEMAKVGAYRTLIVPYAILADGKAHADFVTLGTLEGGHPKVDLSDTDELVRRLMILGATDEEKPVREQADQLIPKPLWRGSIAVSSMISFSNFSGTEGLFDKPIKLSELVSSKFLVELESRMVEFSQQAEGALCAYDPTLDLWVVTATGRDKADKRYLNHSTITPVKLEEGKLLIAHIEGMDKPLRPSIEASELLMPQPDHKLNYPVGLRLTKDGYVLDDNGDIVASPFRSFVHYHRGENTLNKMVKTRTKEAVTQGNVLWLPPSDEDYDHIGCGVDRMNERTRERQNVAIGEWEAGGKKADFVLWYVANHGLMAAEFITADESDRVSFAAFSKIEQAYNDGDIKFTHNVVQV